MKKQRLLILSLGISLLLLALSLYAQIARPYHTAHVWHIAFIHVKPGMEPTYNNYVATGWKKAQEAMKADGMVLSYKALITESHSPQDFNMMLMTEYKDLAAYEASEKKTDALLQTLVGDDAKQIQGYKDRLEFREVLAERVATELVLEPEK